MCSRAPLTGAVVGMVAIREEAKQSACRRLEPTMDGARFKAKLGAGRNTEVRAPSEFARLPSQRLHGDQRNEQVLLDDHGEVAAVLDWENCQSGARAWEFIRSIAYCGLFEQAALEDYVRAYFDRRVREFARHA